MTYNTLDILFGVGIVNNFIETLIKYIVDFRLFYRYSNNFELVGYSDNDWTEYVRGKKSTKSFVFLIKDTTFTQS